MSLSPYGISHSLSQTTFSRNVTIRRALETSEGILIQGKLTINGNLSGDELRKNVWEYKRLLTFTLDGVEAAGVYFFVVPFNGTITRISIGLLAACDTVGASTAFEFFAYDSVEGKEYAGDSIVILKTAYSGYWDFPITTERNELVCSVSPSAAKGLRTDGLLVAANKAFVTVEVSQSF